jgi:hypothetical protein
MIGLAVLWFWVISNTDIALNMERLWKCQTQLAHKEQHSSSSLSVTEHRNGQDKMLCAGIILKIFPNLLYKIKLMSCLWLKYQWLFNKVVDWSFIDEQLIRQTMRYFNLQIPKFCTAYGMFVWRSNLTGGCLPLMILNVVLMSYIIGSFYTSL